MNFREITISSGKKVLAGKSAKNNEELIEQAGKQEIVLHTKQPGSPFVNIKGKPTKKDIKEAAIFCAKYSQAWKSQKSLISDDCQNSQILKKPKIKKNIIIHVFKGKNIYKTKDMKLGTFGVKKFKEILVSKKDIIKFTNNKILTR